MKANKRDGVLLMYSIPTSPTYSRRKLKSVIKKYGLDKSMIPSGTSPSDKFRKSCRDVVNRPDWRNLTDNLGRKVKLSWTLVPTSQSPEHRNKIQYDLMQQVMGGNIDSAKFIENPVEHSIFKMFFHRDIDGSMADRITFQVPRDDDGDVDESTWVDGINYRLFIKEVIKQADIYDNEMDGAQATEVVKGYMRRLNGSLYRRMRAVWYIPEGSVEHANRLQSAVREWADGVIDIHNVPVYESQMDELREFFEERLLEELKGIDEEVALDGKMQDRLLSRLQREIAQFSEVASAYDGKVDRKKIDTVLAVVTGKMTLAMEANLRWKEDKEAARVRRLEEKKRMMKEKKPRTKKPEDRPSFL